MVATSFERLIDVIHALEKGHQRVAGFCEAHRLDFGHDHFERLMESLEKDQRDVSEFIRRFRNADVDDQPLNSWVQFNPEQELSDAIEEVTRLERPTFEETIQAIARFYKRAGNFLDRLHDQSPSERSSELLADLSTRELQNSRKLTERVQGLDDV